MEQLTNEEIAKVFALYLGHNFEEENAKIQPVAPIVGSVIEYITEWGSENLKIHLKPLSAITDRHAIDIAKINFKEAFPDKLNGGGKSFAIRSGKRLVLDYQSTLMKGAFWFESYQYLISNGYAVPLFFGVDHWANTKTAIDLGIAVTHKLVA